jgi:hypothetical protein
MARTEEYLDVVVGDIGKIITGTFHFLEFLLGISYYLGETLANWIINLGIILTDFSIQTWEIIKFTGAELWDFGGGVVKGILLIYYAIWMVFECKYIQNYNTKLLICSSIIYCIFGLFPAFHVILVDLKNFTVHVFISIKQNLNDTQAAVVDHTFSTFSTIPRVICQSLIFIGETTTNFIFGFITLLGDFLTQIVLAPLNVIYKIMLLLVKIFDIPFYLWEIYENVPTQGKAGLLVVLVLCVIYWKVSFLTIPKRLWNIIKSSYRGLLQILNLLKNYKRIYQHIVNPSSSLDSPVKNSNGYAKAL